MACVRILLSQIQSGFGENGKVSGLLLPFFFRARVCEQYRLRRDRVLLFPGYSLVLGWPASGGIACLNKGGILVPGFTVLEDSWVKRHAE